MCLRPSDYRSDAVGVHPKGPAPLSADERVANRAFSRAAVSPIFA